MSANVAAADEPAVRLRPIDFGVLSFGIGGLGALDAPQSGSTELSAGVRGAEVDFLGAQASAVSIGVLVRPLIGTSEIYGTAIRVDSLMFGYSSQSEGLCVGLPMFLCDQDTGRLGLGLEVASIHIVPQSDRREVRVVAADLIVAPSPAFDPASQERRLLFRAGATVDSVAPRGFDSHEWLVRAAAGVDGAVAFGTTAVEATVHYRPNLLAFIDDYGFEARVDIQSRLLWDGLVDRANLRLGFALVYQHWSDPTWAFGADRVADATDSLSARLVFSPSLFSVLQ